jgi:hypothetical protein
MSRHRSQPAIVAVLLLCAVIAAAVFALINTRGAQNDVVTTGSGRVSDRFVPPTRIVENNVQMYVTFPDGTRIQLAYPRALRVAQLGFTPEAEVGDNVWTVLISYNTVRAAYGSEQPLATYVGAHGETVGLYSGVPLQMAHTRYLVFQFGPWLAEIDDAGMTEGQRANLGHRLTGSITSDGYLVLGPSVLKVRSADAVFGSPTAGAMNVELIRRRCSPSSPPDVGHPTRFVQAGETGASWCDRSTGVQLSVTGPKPFVDAAARGLEVQPASADAVGR